MNILILTTHLNIGGIPRYVVNLSKFLKENGNNVFVGISGGEWVNLLEESGVEIITLPINTKSIISFKIIKSFLILSRFLRYQNIDIVHANTRVTQFLAYLLFKLRGIPYISTFHGCYKPHFFRKLFKFKGLKSIAVSQYVKSYLIDNFNMKAKDIKVIYNGIEIISSYQKGKIFNSYEKSIEGFPVIGTVSRLSPEKNIHLLIKAMPLILKKFPQAKLVVLGEGRQENYLKDLVVKLSLEDKVAFLKKIPPFSIFSLMDIFVSLSEGEPFGFSVIEAQSAGVPVIVSNSGALKEIVDDGITGIVLKDNLPKQLLEAVSMFVEDSEFRSKTVDNAGRKIEKYFSLQKMGGSIYSLYEEILNGS